MGAFHRPSIVFGVFLLLAGCASSETRSVVSKEDLPGSRYQRLAVFIENLDEGESALAEQVVVSALQGAGIHAVDGPGLLRSRGTKLSEKDKARIVQKEFDAVLYLTVLDKGLAEELVPNAQHDGESITFSNSLFGAFGLVNATFVTNITTPTNERFVLKDDGTVYARKLVLKTRADLQDTKSAKPIWSSETISSGDAGLSNMNLLFSQAAQQIIEKMRADGVI